jgi:uncharacterized Rmd1/YagE family protein
LYVILTADTDTDDSLLVFKYGSDDAQNYIQQSLDARGEISSFVVGILVDGVFQDGIDPYMFQKPMAQTKSNFGLKPLGVFKVKAKDKSILYNQNVYIIQKKDDSLVIKVGEDDAYKIIYSPEFKSVIATYNDGKEINLPLIPPPTQQANVTTIVLNSNDLEEIKENAKIASEASTEKMYVVELNDGSYSYEAGADNLFILQSTNELKDVIVAFENGVEMPYNFGYEQPKENVSDVFVEQTDELTDEDLKGLDDLDVDTLGHIELDDLEDINFDEE